MAGLDKVAVVGAGSVGAAVAYASVIGRVAGEIASFDVNEARPGPRFSTSVTACSSSAVARSRVGATSRCAVTPIWWW